MNITKEVRGDRMGKQEKKGGGEKGEWSIGSDVPAISGKSRGSGL
jgi:hypothetical protein